MTPARDPRFAPPQADVADITAPADARRTPALWNPNAAANWSLLLTPAFGAFLHMKNWQSLGDAKKAAASKTWFIAVIVVFTLGALASGLLPDGKFDGLGRAVGIGMLIAWYFQSAREQVAVVKGRYGKAYPRKGWLKALALGVLGVLAYFLALVVLGVVVGLLAG
jgi:hypothetical protein